MKGLYWEAKDEEDLSIDLKQELCQYKKMPCFYIRDNQPIPAPIEWGPYLHPTHLLTGAKGSYYWTVVKNVLDIDFKRVVNFKKFSHSSYS
jgi:hypothetical protein